MGAIRETLVTYRERYIRGELLLELVQSGPYGGHQFFQILLFKLLEKGEGSIAFEKLLDNFH